MENQTKLEEEQDRKSGISTDPEVVLKEESQPEKGSADRVFTYFAQEKGLLTVITITGLIYNVGMLVGPWFEGQLAQKMMDILGGIGTASQMLRLAAWYLVSIFFVQAMRYVKRRYVRKFANRINLRMKQNVFARLLGKSIPQMEEENTGKLMTRAVSDVEACAEGMRKFTTEIFDTLVVMIAYLVMLMIYDWKLTLLVSIFPPIAYFLAERCKVVVTQSTAKSRAAADELNALTLDRVSNAVTYRVYGQETNRNRIYDRKLTDYQKKNQIANLWNSSMQPLYQVVALIGTIFILYFGGKNVAGSGWSSWNIAAFSTYISCFLKLALKASKSAKLFNAVQKASVSWKRIKPYLSLPVKKQKEEMPFCRDLCVQDVSFTYPNRTKPVFHSLNLQANAGEWIGVTGEVASGKTSLGLCFTGEYPFEGFVRVNGKDFDFQDRLISWTGHAPQLFSATIRENLSLADKKITERELWEILQVVCMDEEVKNLPDGLDTYVGEGGVRFSGGQQARIALARALLRKAPVLVLDDPFSAVDRETEEQIFSNMKEYLKDDCIVFLISHRLRTFRKLDQVLWMEKDGAVVTSTHEELFRNCPAYAKMVDLQEHTESGAEKNIHLGEENRKNNVNETSNVNSKNILEGNLKNRGQEGKLSPGADQTGKNRAFRNRLVSFAFRHPAVLIGLILIITLSVIFGVLPPLVLQRAVDLLAAGNQPALSIALLYFLFCAISGISNSAKEGMITVFGQLVSKELRADMAKKLNRLPASYFTVHEPGSVTSLFMNDVEMIEDLFSSGIISMISDLFEITAILFVVFRMSLGLGALLALCLPILFALTRAFQKRMLAAQKANRKAIAKANAVLPETLNNYPVIRILRLGRYVSERYEAALKDSFASVERSSFYDAVYSPIVITISAALVSLMMSLSVMDSGVQQLFGMTAGTVVALIAYVGKVFGPLESIGKEIQSLQSAVAGIARIREFLEEKEMTSVPVRQEDRLPPVLIRNLAFGYDEEVLFSDYSLTVQQGENLVLTGRTGIGKSTLFRLILGLYPPKSGEIAVFGRDPQSIPEEERRRIYGYVEQTFHPISGSMKDQITLGNESITDEEVRSALQLTGMEELFEQFSEGWDTPCSKDLLSQGQWQLLSIARAVVKNPKLLLLDEITANLDSVTEMQVKTALERASGERTVISISHRQGQEA